MSDGAHDYEKTMSLFRRRPPDAIPEGWGVYGMRDLGNWKCEVWLIRLPVPKPLPDEWPTRRVAGGVLGRGASIREATADAVKKIPK